MDFRTHRILAIAGALAAATAAGGFVLYRHVAHHATEQLAQFVPPSTPAPASPAPPAASAAPTAAPSVKPVEAAFPEACLRKGIAVSLASANFHVSGPPALTVVTGDGVGDEIDFATRDGLARGCSQPSVAAKAIVLNFDAMDKQFGAAAAWRAAFCRDTSGKGFQVLCKGEERAAGAPRRLALAAIYDATSFNGDGMFPNPAPDQANFAAWKARLVKANTPPPVQADGAFDIYPGNIWLERDNTKAPLLFTCDMAASSQGGSHYCLGTVTLDQGLRARIEFRATSDQIGAEALAAEEQLQTLLAAWQ